ncbi:MAG TPA: thioesterase family protein [Brumimicrobium sp.]|nr:thioesterase family protein [Brumimicrobium sp.]
MVEDFLYSADFKLRVRYGETDQMGYCYYGNYAQYFEVGRVEALRELGMTYKELEEKGYMLPVSTYNVKYFSPALYDDLLTITTKIKSQKGVRLHFAYTIKNEIGNLLAEADTVLVFVDKKSMKPTSPPKEFVALLSTKKGK